MTQQVCSQSGLNQFAASYSAWYITETEAIVGS